MCYSKVTREAYNVTTLTHDINPNQKCHHKFQEGPNRQPLGSIQGVIVQSLGNLTAESSKCAQPGDTIRVNRENLENLGHNGLRLKNVFYNVGGVQISSLQSCNNLPKWTNNGKDLMKMTSKLPKTFPFNCNSKEFKSDDLTNRLDKPFQNQDKDDIANWIRFSKESSPPSSSDQGECGLSSDTQHINIITLVEENDNLEIGPTYLCPQSKDNICNFDFSHLYLNDFFHPLLNGVCSLCDKDDISIQTEYVTREAAFEDSICTENARSFDDLASQNELKEINTNYCWNFNLHDCAQNCTLIQNFSPGLKLNTGKFNESTKLNEIHNDLEICSSINSIKSVSDIFENEPLLRVGQDLSDFKSTHQAWLTLNTENITLMQKESFTPLYDSLVNLN